MTPNELESLDLAASKKRLKQRLNEAIPLLDRKLRAYFTAPTFDFENRCLVSDCGNWKLQWKLRNNPNLPESYTNQQTNRGVVEFQKIHKPVVQLTPAEVA